MKRIIVTGMIAALALGCSRDEPSSSAAPVAAKKTTAAPGVSATSQSELGPQHNRDEVAPKSISVTSTSKEAVEHFLRGRELFENIRHEDARVKFKKALELDPEFALAYAYLGEIDKNEKGLELIEKGLELADTLPPAERLVVKQIYLKRVGNRDGARDTVRKLAELAPGDFRVQVMLAQERQEARDLEGALRAYEAATKLNPEAAEPYNYIAYLHANAGRYGKAIRAAKTYSKLKPNEPNPHDSLGEILMMAGELEDAEKAFLKAVEVEPSFRIAWEGVAYTRMYREDWAGGIEALEKAAEGLPDEKARLKSRQNVAWAQLASGDSKAAFATLDDVEKRAAKAGLDDYPRHLEQVRGEMYLIMGKPRQARRHVDHAIKMLKKADAKGDQLGWALIERTWVQSALGDKKGAAKSLRAAEEIGKDVRNAAYGHGLNFARGAVALAEGDSKAAIDHFGKISSPMYPYAMQARWLTIAALDKAGKKQEATVLRADIVKSYRRNVFHAVMRKRVSDG